MGDVHFLTSQMPQQYVYFFVHFPSPTAVVNTSCCFDIICPRTDIELKVPAVPSHSVSSDQERSLNEHRTRSLKKTYERNKRQSPCFGGVCDLLSESRQTYKEDFKHLKCLFYISLTPEPQNCQEQLQDKQANPMC